MQLYAATFDLEEILQRAMDLPRAWDAGLMTWSELFALSDAIFGAYADPVLADLADLDIIEVGRLKSVPSEQAPALLAVLVVRLALNTGSVARFEDAHTRAMAAIGLPKNSLNPDIDAGRAMFAEISQIWNAPHACAEVFDAPVLYSKLGSRLAAYLIKLTFLEGFAADAVDDAVTDLPLREQGYVGGHA